MQPALEHTFMRTLRQLYDTENQLALSLGAVDTGRLTSALRSLIIEIEAQSRRQSQRLEEIFRVLYQKPRGEASWVATALLREAWQAAASDGPAAEVPDGATEPCAAALLALKRYELTLYELLLRWSEACDLLEALPPLRRSIAEEMVAASSLAELAFSSPSSSLKPRSFEGTSPYWPEA